jgi:hypothetical protein
LGFLKPQFQGQNGAFKTDFSPDFQGFYRKINNLIRSDPGKPTLQAVRGGHRIAKPAFRTDFHIPSLPFEKTIALKLTRNPLDPQFYRPRAGFKPVFD